MGLVGWIIVIGLSLSVIAAFGRAIVGVFYTLFGRELGHTILTGLILTVCGGVLVSLFLWIWGEFGPGWAVGGLAFFLLALYRSNQ